MKKIKKFITRAMDWLVFIMTGKGPVGDEGVDAGIIDYSGQGRDTYGR